MNYRIIFVTGVNGVGKTTVMEPLRTLLGSAFRVHDFDERGVPDNVDRQWRLDETQYWIALAKENAQRGVRTVVCGFAKPSETQDSTVGFVLLDADPDTIAQRLWSRYKTPESVAIIERVSGKPVQKFIDDNVYYAKVMREEAVQHGVGVIETTNLTPVEVAREVAALILAAH